MAPKGAVYCVTCRVQCRTLDLQDLPSKVQCRVGALNRTVFLGLLSGSSALVRHHQREYRLQMPDVSAAFGGIHSLVPESRNSFHQPLLGSRLHDRSQEALELMPDHLNGVEVGRLGGRLPPVTFVVFHEGTG